MRTPRALPPNAILEQTEPTHQRLYSAMGEPLLFQTNEPVLLEAADEAFGRFPHVPHSTSSPLVIRLFVHHVGPDPADQQEVERPRPIYRTQGHLFYIAVGAKNTAVVDLLQGYAFGFVTPGVAYDRTFVRYTFLEAMAFAMLGPARGFIPIHAACVVKAGMSILLCGAAGTGKSTLAFACARRGDRVLAEDVVQVKIQPHGVRLWGVPWKLHLLPDSKRLFPELEEEQVHVQMNDERKLEVDLEALFPGSTTTHAAPGLVLFLERGGGPGSTRIEHVPLDEALEIFEVVWPWWVGWTEEMEQGVSHLLKQGVYRMRMNGSPDEAADALDALLTQVKRGTR